MEMLTISTAGYDHTIRYCGAAIDDNALKLTATPDSGKPSAASVREQSHIPTAK